MPMTSDVKEEVGQWTAGNFESGVRPEPRGVDRLYTVSGFLSSALALPIKLSTYYWYVQRHDAGWSSQACIASLGI
jgi:hypothetical protein